MSAKREKKRRYNQRLEYIRAFERWLASEPPRLRFILYRRWKAIKPKMSDFSGSNDHYEAGKFIDRAPAPSYRIPAPPKVNSDADHHH